MTGPLLIVALLRAAWRVWLCRAVVRDERGRVLALAHGDGRNDDTDALQGAWDGSSHVVLPERRHFALRELRLHGCGTFDTNGSTLTVTHLLSVGTAPRVAMIALHIGRPSLCKLRGAERGHRHRAAGGPRIP